MADFDLILRSGLPVAVPRTVDRGILGEVIAYAGFALPSGFSWCDGQKLSGLTYRNLFAVIGAIYGTSDNGASLPTLAVTSGSTLVTSSAPHGLTVNHGISSGIANSASGISLPAGISTKSVVPLFVTSAPSSTTFTVSTDIGGADVSFTATVSGQTFFTHFLMPDLRGRSVFGRDNMGGTDANRLTTLTSDGDILGVTGGAETHTLSIGEMPAHTHDYSRRSISTTITSGAASRPASALETQATTSAGGGAAHNNLPPLQVVNYIIRVG